ncbi:Predicted glutamine synthetase [Phaffia rhodozyma]|uniref:Predicted glutamine synthetase n=1 Tax=Phaffia rhodozyma TaxID=264483 RepID=A0A0F7SF52_PHARH|nr:Predicted glutamine synthetase [Phaffia rhodozyma]
MTKPSNVLTVAFLACDKIPEESEAAHGEYADVLHNLFEPHIPDHLNLETRNYDVVNARKYPTEAELDQIDAIVISGSFEDDADKDTTWILRLAGFLIRVKDDYPRIRMIGICFGLQIIARAFGPSLIEKNEKGWEVGSTKVNLTKLGKRIIWDLSDDDEEEGVDVRGHIMMQQIHSDIVREVPENFELLAYSELTPIQGIVNFYDSEDVPPFTHSEAHTLPDDPWRKIHIIAFQGHPEWHDGILVPLIDNYEKDGTFDKEFAKDARERSRQHHDGKRLGQVLLRVLGVA